MNYILGYALFSLTSCTSVTNAFVTECKAPHGKKNLALHQRTSHALTLYGVLSKADILRATKSKSSSNKKECSLRSIKREITIDYVSVAIEEAIFRQLKILDVLSENEYNRNKEISELGTNNNDIINTPTDSIARRRDEIKSNIRKLHDLKEKSVEIKKLRSRYRPTSEKTQQLVKDLETLGFQSLLQMDQEQWSIIKEKQKEFGRPGGFSGHVFLSPAGVPILVGKERAHSDETLRSISQGADLWFQVSDYEGSRVLLRTSTKRGMKGSKHCIQMAADLAVYFSSHRRSNDMVSSDDGGGVRVMYTDSKHVAKRGSKVGQMRQNKSLGYIIGHSEAVENMVEGKI